MLPDYNAYIAGHQNQNTEKDENER
jgi:hypothetical protein